MTTKLEKAQELDNLHSEWIHAKSVEKKANELRLKIEEKYLALIQQKRDGTVSMPFDDGDMKVVFDMKFAIKEPSEFEKVMAKLNESDAYSVETKVIYSVPKENLLYLEEKYPQKMAELAEKGIVEYKPAKPSFTFKAKISQ